MEHIVPRTVWPFLLAAVITMMIAGNIMVTAVNVAAATAVSHFSLSLAGSGLNVFVDKSVHLAAISANHTTPSTKVKSLVCRVNVLTSTIPLILVVPLCTLGILLYVAYRSWYRRLTSPQVAPPVQQSSPAPTPGRRQPIRRAPRPLACNSQVTLPRYSPPPPSYRERQPDHCEHIEMVEMSHRRSSENRAEEQQYSPAASPAPSH